MYHEGTADRLATSSLTHEQFDERASAPSNGTVRDGFGEQCRPSTIGKRVEYFDAIGDDVESLLLPRPKHNIWALEHGRIVKRADLDDYAIRNRRQATGNMNTAPTAKFSRGRCIGSISVKPARLALRIAKGTRLDPDKQIPRSA